MADRDQTIGSGQDQPDIVTWEASLTVSQTEKGTLFDEVYTESTFSINTTSATELQLTSDSDSERPIGIEGTGIRIVPGANFALTVQMQTQQTDDTFILEWFEIDMGGNQGSDGMIKSNSDISKVPILRNLLLHGMDAGNSFRGFIQSTNRDARISNCFLYDLNRSTASTCYGINIDADQPEGGVVNVTVYGITNPGAGVAVGIRIITNDADAICKNNIVAAVDDTDFEFGGTNPDSDNNLSEDATADDGGGSNNVINATTINFVDPTGSPPDFHLANESSDAHAAGQDLGTTRGVNIDIDGTDRDVDIGSDAWDIGAHQLIVAGAPAAPTRMLLMGVGV